MLHVAGVDLRDVAWVGGKYAESELSKKLATAADVFVERAVRALAECIARPEQLKALAFCVDIAHAHAIQARLAQHGLRAEVLTGASQRDHRDRAQERLNGGDLQVLCVVDIYNEGVDVPNVNAIFFFRPTESATVFLQQLGRGLRRARNKAELVVFDLTGRQHHRFRFDRKLRAALGHTPKELENLLKDRGFGRLPAGCMLHFDERARDEVLAQVRRSIPNSATEIAKLLAEPALRDLPLDAFLRETDVELADLYAGGSWTLLRQKAGLERAVTAADEAQVLKRLGNSSRGGLPRPPGSSSGCRLLRVTVDPARPAA